MSKKRAVLLALPLLLGVVFLLPTLVSCASSGDEKLPLTFAAPNSPPLEAALIDSDKTKIKIEKENYLLHLYEGNKVLRSYPVVLGPDPINDKKMEGDGCTPEGTFKIKSKYPHKSWSRFLWIDYPNADSWRKFNARKASGEIPSEATIGGDIGIHGVPTGRNDIMDDQVNWTLGCISLRTEHILEIYPLVKEGTVVEIVR